MPAVVFNYGVASPSGIPKGVLCEEFNPLFDPEARNLYGTALIPIWEEFLKVFKLNAVGLTTLHNRRNNLVLFEAIMKICSLSMEY